MKKLSALIVAVLMAGIFFQVVYLFGKYVPDLISVRSNLGKSSAWRGANFNQSEKVADFIVFLNQNIPENARVVLPSLGSNRKILTTPYMQLFLAPREVINCPNVECIQTISGENTFIVIIGEFPINLSEDHSSLMFDEHWGLLLPDGFSAGEAHPSVKDFNSLWDLLWVGIWPLLWIVGLTFAGTLMVKVLLPGQETFLNLAFGYGMGLGMFSIGVAILGVLGFSLSKGMILISTIALLGVVMSIFFLYQSKLKSTGFPVKSESLKKNFDLLPLIFISLGVVSIVLAVGKGYHRLDAIQIWGAKGYGIAASGSLDTVTDWGTNTLAYPLHIPVLIAAFRVLFGDVLPASKMIFGGYYLALMLVMYYVLLGIGVKRMISCIAVMLMMTTPLIFRHATIGYANLTLTFYLVASIAVFIIAYNRIFTKWNLFLSGFFLVCAAWTRPEGLVLAFGSIVLLLFLVTLDPESSLSWKRIARYVAPLIIYIFFWQIVKNTVYPKPFSNSNLLSEALVEILDGELHLSAVFYILLYLLQELTSQNVFGWLGFSLFLAGSLIIISRKSIPRSAGMLMAVGGLWIAMMVGMYYLISYDDAHDLSWWIISGLNRMIFPGLIVLWIGLVAAMQNALINSE